MPRLNLFDHLFVAILCDNGSVFISAEFKACLDTYGVCLATTLPYNSTGNAVLERAHQSVRHAVNTWIETLSGDLEAAAECAMFSHNSLPMDSGLSRAAAGRTR